MPDEEYLTVEEVAVQLKVSEETVRRMLRSGRLDGARLGPRRAGWRVAASEVAKLLRPRRRSVV